MQAAFAQEILQSQLEVQNQTLQYVGQELHDNLGQLLSVVRFGLNSLEENPLATSVHPQISETNEVVAQAINDLRAQKQMAILCKILGYQKALRTSYNVLSAPAASKQN